MTEHTVVLALLRSAAGHHGEPLPALEEWPLAILFVFILVGVILAVSLTWQKSGTGQFLQGTRGSGRRERALYQELLRKALGDHDLVARLIALESKKRPHAGREVWMQRAIDAWKRHNQ